MAGEFFNVDRPIDEWLLNLRSQVSKYYEDNLENAAFDNISDAYPDIEDYLRDAREVVTLTPWNRWWYKIGDLRIHGRRSWLGGYPDWDKKIIYYNTARRNLKATYDTIVLHHTDNAFTVLPNELKHRWEGYASLGYHFFVERVTSMVYEGRPVECMGSNAGVNKMRPGPLHDPDWGKIGIVLQGDFHSEDNRFFDSSVWEGQFAAMKSLVQKLAKEYDINRLVMHREIRDTDCPGDALAPRIIEMRNELGMRGV